MGFLSHARTLCAHGIGADRDRLAETPDPRSRRRGPAWARAAEAIAAAVPDGQARLLEGQGHRVADEVLIPVLTGFFA